MQNKKLLRESKTGPTASNSIDKQANNEIDIQFLSRRKKHVYTKKKHTKSCLKLKLRPIFQVVRIAITLVLNKSK